MSAEKRWEDCFCEAETETRCYTISGPPCTLDMVERLLQRIERTGEEAAVRWFLTLVDGRENKIRFRVLASWREEE